MSKAHALPDPRKARENAGITREQLAAAAGVSFNTVATCEQEKRFPKQRLVRQRYLAALKLTEAAK